MWMIAKINKNQSEFLKLEFKKKFGEDFIFYTPKILIEKFKKNKLTKISQDILNDYIFCYHSNFCKKSCVEELKYSRGLKYFLIGFENYQKEIENFVNRCRSLENEKGLITQSLFDLYIDQTYKFNSGPFVDKIFKIINFEKNKINTLMGNIKTTIRKKKYIFSH